MSRLRMIALALLWPVMAVAQTAEDSPLIRLQPVPPAVEAPVAEAPTGEAPAVVAPAGEAPAAGSEDASPQIMLTAPETEATGEVAPVPMDRDAGDVADVAAPAVASTWLLALVPADPNVPTEVRIGGSMPAPGQFRLSGETARADFSLTLPEDMAVPKELVLSLRSSANVLADSSRLKVLVNGTEAGTLTLDNIGAFAQVRLETAALLPGANMISLQVAQTHRIFCGPEASFAVWTEINLGESGVLIDPALLRLDAQGFLAAAQSQVARGGAIEILVDDKTDTALVRDVARRITDAVGGAPKIAVMPFYAMETDRAARARIALISGRSAKTSFRRGAGGALVLQIEHAAGVVPDLAAILPPRPSDWAVAALVPGRVTTLAELGADTILANTHYFRRDVNFLLPDDWLLLASQKALFTLHYGFSADLPKGGILLVKVNGQTVRLLPLDREGGKVQPPLPISFRANRLNPGINTLTFEMTVPGDPPDLPCTPRSADMLVVLGDSAIEVPPSPKMRQADMSRSLARLDGGDVMIPPEVANPARDTDTLLAFGALLRPLVVDASKARLHVVGLDGVGLVPTGGTGVTRRMLQNAVYPALKPPVVADGAAGSGTAPAGPGAVSPGYSLANADGQVVAPDAAPPPAASLWEPVSRFFSPEGWLFREVGGGA